MHSYKEKNLEINNNEELKKKVKEIIKSRFDFKETQAGCWITLNKAHLLTFAYPYVYEDENNFLSSKDINGRVVPQLYSILFTAGYLLSEMIALSGKNRFNALSGSSQKSAIDIFRREALTLKRLEIESIVKECRDMKKGGDDIK